MTICSATQAHNASASQVLGFNACATTTHFSTKGGGKKAWVGVGRQLEFGGPEGVGVYIFEHSVFVQSLVSFPRQTEKSS